MCIRDSADLVVVAPATADLLARAAHGLANDLLTNVLLTARCPVVMAPAMHTEMWLHPATQANVATLRARGVHVIDPAVGRLTGVDTGPGRLPEPADIHAAAMAVLPSRRDDAPAGDEHVPAPDAQRAVSYTHLDVYKRQGPGHRGAAAGPGRCGMTAGSQPAASQATASQPAASQAEALAELHRIRGSIDNIDAALVHLLAERCLLYTSRCV